MGRRIGDTSLHMSDERTLECVKEFLVLEKLKKEFSDRVIAENGHLKLIEEMSRGLEVIVDDSGRMVINRRKKIKDDSLLSDKNRRLAESLVDKDVTKKYLHKTQKSEEVFSLLETGFSPKANVADSEESEEELIIGNIS